MTQFGYKYFYIASFGDHERREEAAIKSYDHRRTLEVARRDAAIGTPQSLFPGVLPYSDKKDCIKSWLKALASDALGVLYNKRVLFSEVEGTDHEYGKIVERILGKKQEYTMTDSGLLRDLWGQLVKYDLVYESANISENLGKIGETRDNVELGNWVFGDTKPLVPVGMNSFILTVPTIVVAQEDSWVAQVNGELQLLLDQKLTEEQLRKELEISIHEKPVVQNETVRGKLRVAKILTVRTGLMHDADRSSDDSDLVVFRQTDAEGNKIGIKNIQRAGDWDFLVTSNNGSNARVTYPQGGFAFALVVKLVDENEDVLLKVLGSRDMDLDHLLNEMLENNVEERKDSHSARVERKLKKLIPAKELSIDSSAKDAQNPNFSGDDDLYNAQNDSSNVVTLYAQQLSVEQLAVLATLTYLGRHRDCATRNPLEREVADAILNDFSIASVASKIVLKKMLLQTGLLCSSS